MPQVGLAVLMCHGPFGQRVAASMSHTNSCQKVVDEISRAFNPCRGFHRDAERHAVVEAAATADSLDPLARRQEYTLAKCFQIQCLSDDIRVQARHWRR
jgi:hypothetical protein